MPKAGCNRPPGSHIVQLEPQPPFHTAGATGSIPLPPARNLLRPPDVRANYDPACGALVSLPSSSCEAWEFSACVLHTNRFGPSLTTPSLRVSLSRSQRDDGSLILHGWSACGFGHLSPPTP